MIELRQNELVFSFPEVHPLAKLSINFQRTLRIPDDDKTYPLPPGLGSFPLVHVDDHSDSVPPKWLDHGGIILPMYQAEAMWLNFHPHSDFERGSAYPFAIKVSTGKIDAVTGKDHTNGLHLNPQDYLVSPGQPWLDGYCVKKGVIRQFVAMPLGEGYTAEEQITRKADYGGIQIVVYPMKGEVFDRKFPKIERQSGGWQTGGSAGGAWGASSDGPLMACAPGQEMAFDMGLSPGGQMKQEIYKDTFSLKDWDRDHSSRCFAHIANSVDWENITGDRPPQLPPSASDYNNAGLPWFDYYAENRKAVAGSKKLNRLQSVQTLSKKKGEQISNESVKPKVTVDLREGLRPGQVREGDF